MSSVRPGGSAGPKRTSAAASGRGAAAAPASSAAPRARPAPATQTTNVSASSGGRTRPPTGTSTAAARPSRSTVAAPPGAAAAAAAASNAASAAPPRSARPLVRRAASASTAVAAAADDSAAPPPIPLHVHSDPLSRMTLPVLHMICAAMSVAELHSLARANRVLYAATLSPAADAALWKPRWSRAMQAGLGANQQGAAAATTATPARRAGAGAAAAAAPARRGGSAARGRASSAGTAPRTGAAAAASTGAVAASVSSNDGTKGAAMSGAALAHAQAEMQQARQLSHAPSSLPASSVYRWALLASLRRDSAGRFARWVTNRARNVQTTLVHKPVAEWLGLKLQLRIQLAQRPLHTPLLPSTAGSIGLFDNALGAAWRAEAGVLLRDLRSVGMVAHSACLMRSFPIGSSGGDGASAAGSKGPGAASSTEREWVLVRQGANEQSLSLLEWRLKGSGDPMRRPAANDRVHAALNDEHGTDSPFAPNPARRERMAAAAAVSASARSRASSSGSFLIPGLHLHVLAGVWGKWDGSTTTARSAELAFLWLSAPYPLLLSHLPVPSLPASLRCAALQWTVQPDDLDSALGLHGLRVNVALRSAAGPRGGRTFWSWFYTQVRGQLRREEPAPSGALGRGAVELLLPPLSAPRWNAGLPALSWKGELWSGRFDRLLLLDLVVTTDDARVLWLVSQPVSLEQLSSPSDAIAGAGLSMDAPDEQAYAGMHRDMGVGAVRFEMTHAPAVHASADGRRVEVAAAAAAAGGPASSSRSVDSGAGMTRLQSLHIALDLSFIDARFGTTYARAGAASLSHALQSRAANEMSDQQYAQFQREQMGLRAALDEERPLPAQQRRGGAGPSVGGATAAAAGAPHHAPDFTVHAPPRRAARPQWQDVGEKRDEDEGFKF